METTKQTGAATNVSSPKIELSDFLENEPPEVIEAKQLVTLAHALAVAVDEHQDRSAPPVDRLQDMRGKSDRLVDAERSPIRNTNHEYPATGSQRRGASNDAIVVPDLMAIGKQRGENVIERHGCSSRSC